ncbi:NeuD/PglB/VioB family sugar acetyltransferase [Amycolatopsis thermoflava]|uniref:NeuD/PglB/VioB family sugar acetyltransferase n=1 Tax=Amycolatopsis thermoflava TaxID=84480 RepID=UPI003D70F77B
MSKNLVVLGAGGLARQIVGVVEDLEDINLLGLLGDPDEHSRENDTPVLGGDEVLKSLDAAYVIGVANLLVRRKLEEYASAVGREPATVVHPTARIEKRVSIGPGGVVMPAAQVQEAVELGCHVLVDANVLVCHEAVVSPHVTISPRAVVGARSRIGAGTTIGMGAIVLPDVAVGEEAVIGAGAVVTKDVPGQTTVAGVPARVLR